MNQKVSRLTGNKLWLAPLAGLSDKPFRIICKRNGADVVVTEMVSADGLVFDYERSARFAHFTEEERPTGIQLFGSRPETMAEACRLMIRLKPDFIDINMGCPVKKVIKRGAGSALMKDIPVAISIVKEVKSVLRGTDIPLSVKFRSGWDSDSIVAVDFAQALQKAGADILILHPRTRTQLYSGRSDWSIIKEVKDRVDIPVVGNGDITSVSDALRMLEDTGCDSLMIGRGALGQPWLFNEIKSYLLTGEYLRLSYKERFEIIREHNRLALEDKEEERAIKEMRVHYCHYTKGLRGGSKLRNLLNHMTDNEEITRLIGGLYEESY